MNGARREWTHSGGLRALTLRFGMGGLLLGGVTLATGSVQDGILAVSAVATAVQLARGLPPMPGQ
jgi:hypothetical protein